MATDGWSKLGAAFGGLGAERTAAFEKGASNRARLETLFANAKIARDKAIARSQLVEKLTPIMGPEKASMFATLTQGEATDDYKNFEGGFGLSQQNDARDRADEMSLLGDDVGMNRQLAIVNGKPMETARVGAYGVVNPYGAPDQVIHPTPYSQAKVAAVGAETEAVRALAGTRRSASMLNEERAAALRRKVVEKQEDAATVPNDAIATIPTTPAAVVPSGAKALAGKFPKPSARAIQLLRQQPEFAADFDEKYGPGASRVYVK